MPIFKRALDLSFLKDLQNDKSGTQGIYYHRFPKDKLALLKKQLGQIDPTIGIKIFKGATNALNTAELLSLYFIAPEINKIGIKAPYTTQPLSIVNFIHHKYIQPRHYEGSHLTDFDFPYKIINLQTCRSLNRKLNEIGIYWGDCWEKNILFPTKVLNDLQKRWNEIKEDFDENSDALDVWVSAINPDLSDQAIIVDVGSMRCSEDSVAGQNIIEFKNKIFNFMKSRNMSEKFQIQMERVFDFILI
jgi:hypothetical protein